MKLEDKYEPKRIEEKWAAHWVNNKSFRADEASDKPGFSIVIPPPNVTGSLHLGHALNNTLQDMLCRYYRLRGREVLWIPGTDHAGIATQNVVEKQLAKEGTTKNQMGRDAFVKRVWEWKAQSGGQIISQLKRLGCSCDWERERFTMDEGLSQAVVEVFVRLFREGLIYRDNYMINWCPRCESALADLEVEYPDEPESGKLYRLRYPIIGASAGEPGFIEVDTTRPETMLGDTAVAVHPSDTRYQQLIGKLVELPIINRTIPIIADDFVDPAFGSGAVKITPGHDPNDFEAGRRHDLEIVTVIGFDGRMTKAAGPYAGLEVGNCRQAIIKDLMQQGVLLGAQEHELKIGRCYRCQSVTQPLVSTQWFMRMKDLACAAAEAVRSGETEIIPPSWEATYYHWLDNIRDWCISRQLWWGHQIPAWHCGCGKMTVASKEPTACEHCGSKNIKQDPDVLDTWFSSALWPFSTMGWPEKTPLLRKFYPTSVLVTGADILFFWVARMMMMGIKMTEQIPFRQVYLHAMVRDERGQKMSKTKGNVIDPLDIIEQYGADALRFALAIMTVQGRDINLSASRIEGYRNFINKVWNAARFVSVHVGKIQEKESDAFVVRGGADLSNDLYSRWIRSRVAKTIEENVVGYEAYHFSDICAANYRFFWDEFCAWYVEISKFQLARYEGGEAINVIRTLLVVLDASLRLLYPTVPFVASEIWDTLPSLTSEERQALSKASFPRGDDFGGAFLRDLSAEREMNLVISFISAIRTLRSEKNINPALGLEAVVDGDESEVVLVMEHAQLIAKLARLNSITLNSLPENALTVIVSNLKISVVFPHQADVAEERERVVKKIEVLESEIQRTSEKLSSNAFLSKAPQQVVEKERGKLKGFEEAIKVLRASLDRSHQ